MTTVTQTPSSSRSIISRITSPFTAKPKNTSEFDIKLKDPHRTYSPGDVVSGSVTLTVTKPIRLTHLVIGIRGFVKVYKNANPPGKGISKEAAFVGTGRGERGSEYFGNGFATIFERELPLCGEGRLIPTEYSFEFELPVRSRGVPSSIDFERGTISYLLIATLTRPTTISPTSTCHRNINVVESIDVARFRNPKPRLFSLEPLTRRSRSRHHVRTSLTGVEDRTARGHEDTLQANNSAITVDEDGTGIFDHLPQSPVPSEFSSASAISSSNVSFRIGIGGATVNQGTDANSASSPRADKTITAEAEVLRGGCLPGDLIPVRIKIDHTKPIKSIHGIIITLYRQGRIDTYPPLPVGPRVAGQKPRYEEFYPASRTGLGGLSLSSSGTVHQFRMDLAQTFAPLIVDPVKMTAIIQTSVRVPENVFPTISCVPGDIISFKYYVEVVIDLAGKLASQGRFFPKLTITGVTSPYDYPPSSDQQLHDMRGTSQTFNANFADTDQIRREKSVVFCNFEVIIGTKDTGRKTSKRPTVSRENSTIPQWPYDGEDGSREAQMHHTVETSTPSADFAAPQNNYESYNMDNHEEHSNRQPVQAVVPTFQTPKLGEPLDEKERLRRAEAHLLPSAPPLDDEDIHSPASQMIQPSAPPLSVLNAVYQDDGPSAPVYEASSSGAVTELGRPVSSTDDENAEHPADTQSDKQELERQRLMRLASAPDDNEDEDHGMQCSRAAPTTPSAPNLDESEEYHLPTSLSGTEYLPRYQT